MGNGLVTWQTRTLLTIRREWLEAQNRYAKATTEEERRIYRDVMDELTEEYNKRVRQSEIRGGKRRRLG